MSEFTASPLPPPPPMPMSLAERSRALFYGAVMLGMCDGALVDAEWQDALDSLRRYGASPELIEALIVEVHQLLAAAPAEFGASTFRVLDEFGQRSPGPDVVDLYRLFIWAVAADGQSDLVEFETLYSLGDALGLGISAQMFLITEWHCERLNP